MNTYSLTVFSILQRVLAQRGLVDLAEPGLWNGTGTDNFPRSFVSSSCNEFLHIQGQAENCTGKRKTRWHLRWVITHWHFTFANSPRWPCQWHPDLWVQHRPIRQSQTIPGYRVRNRLSFARTIGPTNRSMLHAGKCSWSLENPDLLDPGWGRCSWSFSFGAVFPMPILERRPWFQWQLELYIKNGKICTQKLAFRRRRKLRLL